MLTSRPRNFSTDRQSGLRDTFTTRCCDKTVKGLNRLLFDTSLDGGIFHDGDESLGEGAVFKAATGTLSAVRSVFFGGTELVVSSVTELDASRNRLDVHAKLKITTQPPLHPLPLPPPLSHTNQSSPSTTSSSAHTLKRLPTSFNNND